MPSLRQILSDRAVTEVILLRAARTSMPFEYEGLGAAIHESHDALAALATICILKQRQRPKNDYPREPRTQIALIYCKRSDADDIPMLHKLLEHIRSVHRDIGIWCLPEDGVLIETNAPILPEESTSGEETEKPGFSDPPSAGGGSAYGTLKFRGSFVQEPSVPEVDSPSEQPGIEDLNLGTSDDFEDPDSTEPRTDPTISAEEMEMLFHDSDEDHDDGRSDPEATEDPVR